MASPALENSDEASETSTTSTSSACWHSAVMSHDENGRAVETFGLNDCPPELFLGRRGWVQYYTNAQGLRISSYWWPAAGTARATVVVIHGNGVYCPFSFLKFQGPGVPSSYEQSWVEALNHRGFSVCGIDMQSCGRSEGLHDMRMYLESYTDATRDELQFIQMVRTCPQASFSKPPLYIIGASFGGCVATHCAHALQDQSWFGGAVLLAPLLALHPSPSMNAIYECLGRAISCVLPSLPLVSADVSTLIEKIPDLYEGYQQDPGVYKGPTRARVVLEYILAVNAARANMRDMRFPVLALHSPEDTLTDLRGSRLLIELSEAQDKRFVETPGMWHDLVNEPGSEAVLRIVLDWLEERAPTL